MGMGTGQGHGARRPTMTGLGRLRMAASDARLHQVRTAAPLLGVSTHYWAKVEAGLCVPSSDLLVRFARAAGCSPSEATRAYSADAFARLATGTEQVDALLAHSVTLDALEQEAVEDARRARYAAGPDSFHLPRMRGRPRKA